MITISWEETSLLADFTKTTDLIRTESICVRLICFRETSELSSIIKIGQVKNRYFLTMALQITNTAIHHLKHYYYIKSILNIACNLVQMSLRKNIVISMD